MWAYHDVKIFKRTENLLFTGCRLSAIACRALNGLAEGSANGDLPASASGIMQSPDEHGAETPDEMRLIAVATGLLCQSTADPAVAMESMQSSLKQRKAMLAKFKVVAMRKLPKSQQSSAALGVIAAW